MIDRKIALIGLLAGSLSLASAAPQVESIPVRVDPRIELVSIICRLADYDEYAAPTIDSYDRAVEAEFGRFRTHAAVVEARNLRVERGISFNAPLELALFLDRDRLQQRISLRPLPDWVDRRWDSRSARRFLKKVESFARATRFSEFRSKHAADYRAIEAALGQALGPGIDIEWYRRQYAIPAGTEITIVPNPLSRSANYGLRLQKGDGSLEAFCALATPSAANTAELRYPAAAITALLVHELSHPFANRWVEQHRARLESAATALLQPVKQSMEREAYGAVTSMLNETMVRAMTIRYARDHHQTDVERYALEDDRQKQFYWTEELADRLSRSPDADFASQSETIIAFISEWGAAADAKVAEARRLLAAAEAERTAHGPQIVTLVPPHGAADVSPAVTALTIQFDRPMGPGMALFGDTPDVTGPPQWNGDRTMLTIPVSLVPGRSYGMSLNAEGQRGFESAAGEPLVPREWRFTVAASH